jgi:mono/diheme cytochrome c family protein
MKNCGIISVLWFVTIGCGTDKLLSDNASRKETFAGKSGKEEGKVVSADEILSNRASLGIVNVTVSMDPLYKRPQQFKAIKLSAVLERFTPSTNRLEEQELLFVCSDGYRAILSGKDAEIEKGFLAFSDTLPAERSDWIEIRTSGELLSPAPLYLIWTNASPESRPWPYKIIRIEIHHVGEMLAAARPLSRRRLQKGFQLFQLNCAGCHSVNGAGASIAVDLNVPMNVTEYWKEPVLKRLIANPPSVRRNAKMPSFPLLTEEQIQNLVDYLRSMRHRKRDLEKAEVVKTPLAE